MTPARIYELACPQCDGRAWTIDHDYRGIDGVRTDFGAGAYLCATCRRKGPGWRVVQASPPAFFLQPHRLHPMTQAEFDHWVELLREHFPGNPKLHQLGSSWRPFLPEEFEAARVQHEAEHPVFELRDQDGARRQDPDPRVTREWVDIMVPGDWLEFRRHSGHSLRLVRNDREYIARWRTPTGDDARVRHGLTKDAAGDAACRYLEPKTEPVPNATSARWQAVGSWLQRVRG